MTEADSTDQASDQTPPRRRSTFTPPSQEAEVPLTLGETTPGSPPAQPQTPEAQPPVQPPVSASPQQPPVTPGPTPETAATQPPATQPPATQGFGGQPTGAPEAHNPPPVSPGVTSVPPAEAPAAAAAPTSEPVPQPDSGWDDSVLSPPERRSLSDQEIMQQMGGDGSNTGELIAALQEQMALRSREDEEFESWEVLIRQSYPEDEAEAIVLQGRARFEGVPVEQLAPPTPQPQPEPVVESAPVEPPAPPATVAPADAVVPAEPAAAKPAVPEVAPVVDEPTPELVEPPHVEAENVESEPIVLPRLGGQSDQTLESQPAVESQDAEANESELPATGSFERVLIDPDAATPPTDAWPLAGQLDAPSVESTPQAANEATEEPEADSGQATDWLEAQMRVEEVTVTQDESGTTVSYEAQEVVSIQEAIATKPAPKVPLENLTPQVSKPFGFDHVGVEPTPENTRTDRLLQLLWTWWALGTPVPMVMLGIWLVDTGLNVAQAALAALGGAALAAIPLVVGTLQGSRTGVPTLVSSRAAFGLAGNVFPAVVMVLVRVLVATLVVWAAAWFATGVLVESNYWNGEPALMQVILAAVFALIAAGIAIAGRGVITVSLWVAAGLGLFALLGMFLLGLEPLTTQALERTGGSGVQLVAGISVVMSVLMVFWAHFGGDVARFQRATGGAAGPSIAAVAAVIPAVGIIVWGALLGASGDELRQALLADVFDTLLVLAPIWYPIPAIAVGTLPLIAIAGLAIHSSGYALMSVAGAMPRYVAATVSGAVAALGVIGLVVFVPDLPASLVDLALFVGVIVAAWTGIYAGDVMTRRVPLDARVLIGNSGFPAVRIAPLVGFIVALALGWGVVALETAWLPSMGYLLGLMGQLGLGGLSDAQAGPIVALVVALVFSLLAGIKGGRLGAGNSRHGSV